MSRNNSIGSVIVLGGVQVADMDPVEATFGPQGMAAGGPPAAPGASAGAPAPQAVAMTDEWRRWVAENVLLGNSSESIIETLIRSGFDRSVSIREVQAAMAHPYVRAATQLAATRGLGGATGAASPARLAKRDWVMEMYRKSARLDPATATVPVVKKPSREQFLHEFYAANRPCLIEGAMDEWPAMSRWTMDYLKQKFGDKTVEVQMGRERDAKYEINSNAFKKKMPFAEYVDLIVNGGKTNDFYITANNSGLNRDALAGLWDDIVLFPDYLRTNDPTNRGFFWFGPEGTVTPLHHDLTNNFMAQVVGRKLVKLIAPYEMPNLYNFRHCFWRVDPANPDYEKYPLFRNVRVIDVVLNPGQVLFLPIGWWHAVYGLDISITMTFTGFVYDNDFSSFYSTYNDIDP